MTVFATRRHDQNNLLINPAAKLNTTVEPSGTDTCRPRHLKLKSPGNLPNPQRRKAGASQPISSKAKKVTISQRSMVKRCDAIGVTLQGVHAVAAAKTYGFKLR